MASSINPLAFIQKLTGRENYATWKFAMRSYLEHEELWECVDPGVKDEVKDVKAKSKIILLIDPINYVHVQDARTAREVWLNLQKAFDDSGLTRKVGLLKDLITTSLDSCSSVEDYVNKVMSTAHKLRNIGFAVDDEWLGTLLLAGLPDTYKPMIMAIESSGVSISADLIKTKILQDVKSSGSSAFYTNFNQRNSHRFNRNKGHNKGPRCFSCNGYGHISTNCTVNKKKPNSESKSNNKCNSGFVAAFSAFSVDVDDCWVIDSGASAHMTNRDDWLYDRRTATVATIKMADSKSLQVKGSGNLNLQIPGSGNNTQVIQVRDVLYVPGLATNLLSVSQMARNGCQLQFTKDSCSVYQNQKLILTAKCINNMYVVNDAAYALFTSTYLWHQRLGHLNFPDLAKVKDFTTGTDLPQSINTNNVLCTTCIEGKQTRQSFKHEGTRASDILGLVHSDICGPMEKLSLGGARYFMTFIDDFSRKVYVCFLKSKGDALEKFKEFKNLVENQLNSKIKILRTDNGKEYVNHEFDNFLKNSGIQHQTTNPYTPEQNGLAERMNRTLVERAKCMLLNSSLSKQFWAEAVSTAAYVINRAPTKSLQYKTPEEIWTGKKPDLSNLRIFGCKAMVHIPKEKRQKWDSKSQKLIFVGYCTDTKGYRLYDETKKQVLRSRNVIFLENDLKQDYVLIPLSEKKTDSLQDTLNDSCSTSVDSSDLSTSTVIDNSDTCDADETYIPEEPIKDITIKKMSLRPRHNIKKSYLCQAVTSSVTQLEEDPDTPEAALSSNNCLQWQKAMESEYNSLIENNTWTLTDLPAGRRAIPCKWVFKTKLDVEGNISKYKARLVIKGYEQRRGIDYEEVYAPVVRHTSIRYLIGLAVKHKMKIEQMDAVTAFLQGEIDVELYMEQPPLFKQNDQVCKLNKSIYGLKQASRQWNMKLNYVLQNIGLKRSKVDSCIYYNISEKSKLIISVYVDDLLLLYTDENEAINIKQQLKDNFKMQDIGKAHHCIGFRITYFEDGICIDQTRYIDQILKRFHMSECKPVSTPMEPGMVLTSSGNDILMNIPYQEAIGCLLYLCQGTRPDITYAVNTLSKFNNKPEIQHWQAVKRLMRYLKATRNMKLMFTSNNESIIGYCDADWASNAEDRRSCTGYVFIFQGSAISWNSRRQPTIALSTTEAEYMSLSAAVQEALWLRQLHTELWPQEKLFPLKLYCDNQSAIKLTCNESFQARSKHIDVRHHFVRDKVASGEISVEYVDTKLMTADSLTKATTRAIHEKCSNQMGLYLWGDNGNKYNHSF